MGPLLRKRRKLEDAQIPTPSVASHGDNHEMNLSLPRCKALWPHQLHNPNDDSACDAVSEANFPSYENLPDIVLIEIFSYLNFEDRCNAAYACRRWYDVSRSSVVWSKLDVNVKNSLHMLKSLLILPRSVIHLNMHCDTFDRLYPLWLPDILTCLHERCPGLKTLIIENVFFSKRFCNAKTTTDHVLLHSFETITTGFKRKRCIKECCSEQINCRKYVPKNRPRELSTFSLRYAHSFLSHLSSQISQFLPNVEVLDLTCSANIKPMAIPFFLKLQCLKELYLAECTVSNSALETLLKKIKSLKVLDLEGSHETDDDTFMVLQKHGNFLEQLFLGNTSIESFLVKEGSFPNLQRICFRNTVINDEEISYYIVKMSNLKYIDASFCNFLLLQIMTLEAGAYEKEFVYKNEGNPSAVCHHFKKKYM